MATACASVPTIIGKKRRNESGVPENINQFVLDLKERRKEENIPVIHEIIKLRGLRTKYIFDKARESISGFSRLYAITPHLPEAPANFMGAFIRDLEHWSKNGRPELLASWFRRSGEAIEPSSSESPGNENEEQTESSPLPCAEQDSCEQGEEQDDARELNDKEAKLRTEMEAVRERKDKVAFVSAARIETIQHELDAAKEEAAMLDQQFTDTIASIKAKLDQIAADKKKLSAKRRRLELEKRLNEIRTQKQLLEKEEVALSEQMKQDDTV